MQTCYSAKYLQVVSCLQHIQRELSDSPAHSIGQFGTSTDVSYAEDVYVGYRYFDTYQVKPQFAFGHGLSYAAFTYSDLQLTAHPQEITDQLQSPDALPALYTVKLAVSNDSDITAKKNPYSFTLRQKTAR